MVDNGMVLAYRWFVAPLLFSQTRHDPEIAHMRSIRLLARISRSVVLLRLMRRVYHVNDPRLACTVCGIAFPNRVGLAAGYDKDGDALPALSAVGFGFLEVGTVTWHAQPGNPRPRVFRLPAAGALINRMGFNNQGAATLATRLAALPHREVPIGISLGKSRCIPIEQIDDAIGDYCSSLRILYPYGDFFTVNVSSPNTPGLRSLQDRDHIHALLSALQHEATTMPHPRRPLFVKIAPDLSDQAICDVLDVCVATAVDGIIATNTTRVGEGTRFANCENGGMSGHPLTERSRRIVRFIAQETNGTLPIIGVGGIMNSDDAHRMIDAGASLIQLYTGLIYQGPGLIRMVLHSLTTH